MSDDVGSEVRRGAVINALGTLGKMAAPAFLVVVTRLYGAGPFGIFITASAFVDMANAFLTAGFKDAAMIYVSRHSDDPEEHGALYTALANAFGWSLFFGGVLTLLVLTVGPWVLPQLYDYGSRLVFMVQWMMLGLPLLAFTRLVMAATRGLKIMKYAALVNGGLRPVAQLVFSVAFYFVAPGVTGLAMTYVATYASTALAAVVIFRWELDWRPLWEAMRSFEVDGEVLRFAVPQNLNITLDRFLTNIDVLMLGSLGLSASAVGFYGAGALIVRELRNIMLVFSGAFVPHIVRLHRKERLRELSYRMGDTLRWIATLAIPVCLAVAVLRSDVLGMVEPSFGGRPALFMLVLLPIPYLECALGLAGKSVIMTGHSKLNLTNNIVSGLVNFLLNLWLIPRFGLIGAALASMVSTIVKITMEVTEMRFVVGLPLVLRRFYKPHLAGALAGVGLLGMSFFYLMPLDGTFLYRLGLLAGALLVYGVALTLLLGHVPGWPAESGEASNGRQVSSEASAPSPPVPEQPVEEPSR
jgi:O-antigen/teichoic acid export membrane protein